ncbi:hypothetical protein [Sellimonas intestinalis]|uniref:hypothetical protein n=1 Tax=Sellimonas intestinalis TaxID=1653434 RepID=UPI0015EBA4CD|nr:hypothetical protein [Sellimonas intestinalis]MBA2212603.1 hypothetical protein [Sellimonas intestinalis]
MKVLSIEKPEATSSSHQATIFSILKSKKEGKQWIINNYIQLFCLKDLYRARDIRKGTLDYFYNEYGDWSLFELSANPLLEFALIDFQTFRELRKKYKISLIELLINAINNNKYIYLGIDKYYISFYEEFGKVHCAHHLFINGYDEKEGYFVSHDNFIQGKYCEHNISFDVIERAFEGVLKDASLEADAYVGGIAFLKYRIRYWHKESKNMFEFNLEKIVQSLKEYLMQPFYKDRYAYMKDYVFGIECYDELKKMICYNEDSKNIIDYRAFCCLRDHKKIMIFRLENMQNILKFDLENCILGMREVERELSIIINMILKCNIKNDEEIIERIVKRFDNVKRKEIAILSEAINKMEKIYDICNNSMLKS